MTKSIIIEWIISSFLFFMLVYLLLRSMRRIWFNKFSYFLLKTQRNASYWKMCLHSLFVFVTVLTLCSCEIRFWRPTDRLQSKFLNISFSVKKYIMEPWGQYLINLLQLLSVTFIFLNTLRKKCFIRTFYSRFWTVNLTL